MMTTFETMYLMIAFASLVALIVKKTRLAPSLAKVQADVALILFLRKLYFLLG